MAMQCGNRDSFDCLLNDVRAGATDTEIDAVARTNPAREENPTAVKSGKRI